MLTSKKSSFPAWIKDEVTQPFISANYGAKDYITSFIPKRYEAYCKLMNPVYRDRTVQDKTIMWNLENENEEEGAVFDERVRFEELAREYSIPLERITIEMISYKCGHQLPRYLSGSEVGTLEENECVKLVEELKPFTGTQKCFFYFDDMKVMASGSFSGKEKDISGRLYSGKLEEVLSFYKGTEVDFSPTYWWPEDKSWCVTTNYDNSYTIIGGSNPLIDQLVGNKELECIKVDGSLKISLY
ncbi:hypothetical protein [Gorillibacterium sp. sgz500922]|uniref:hypothetical protein n=1 Tax=Gorillibacterium sp. sgz500922 TaxID=3446694 RepID=UPI003F6687F8